MFLTSKIMKHFTLSRAWIIVEDKLEIPQTVSKFETEGFQVYFDQCVVCFCFASRILVKMIHTDLYVLYICGLRSE